MQREDGHFVFELEADATIPAEYVLLRHYLGEPPTVRARSARSRNYLRRIQAADGGWPLFHAGAFDISASVKAYFALKMIGDPIDAPHMKRARAGDPRAWRRGAIRNVFTRDLLALYGTVPWRARAGDAGRDHAAAAMVSVPSLEDLLLGAHRARAAEWC